MSLLDRPIDPIESSFYLVLKSNAFTKLYADNTQLSFKNKIITPINMSGNWEVALIDMQIHRSKTSNFGHCLWFYTNITVNTQVGADTEPLLAHVPINSNKKGWFSAQPHKHYVPLKQLVFDHVYVDIKSGFETRGRSKAEVGFQRVAKPSRKSIILQNTTHPTTVVLHFRKSDLPLYLKNER